MVTPAAQRETLVAFLNGWMALLPGLPPSKFRVATDEECAPELQVRQTDAR
jgi:hypothetical protein